MTWFERWFNSPYYHLLYRHRNEKDAGLFSDHLIANLQLPAGAKVLDLGCGRGRHSMYLNQKGFTVTGMDISEDNIRFCRRFENAGLSFFVHDMRKRFAINEYDLVLNLFTSFGFFETDDENRKALANACRALKKGGRLVIDYLNTSYLEHHLQPSTSIEVEGITFEISRYLEEGFFCKEIRFNDQGKACQFTEKVEALRLSDFERYLLPCGMKIESVAGDYRLNPYDETTSPRLILVAIKSGI